MSDYQFPLDQSELSFTASGGSSIRRTVLPSGVRVLTETMPSAQSASVSFSVAVGSRDETNGHYGSTHFLEHLLFKGTKKRTALDIAIEFDKIGGSSNASTGKEHTGYYARVQDTSLPVAVDVIADMLTSSLIDPVEFENERTVILEELAMNDDDPEDVAHEAFCEAVLGAHALGRPIGGTPETIKAVTRDAVWEYYKNNYRPQDLVVAAAGGVMLGREDLARAALQLGLWGFVGIVFVTQTPKDVPSDVLAQLGESRQQQRLAAARPRQVDLDDLQRTFGLEGDGGAGFHGGSPEGLNRTSTINRHFQTGQKFRRIGAQKDGSSRWRSSSSTGR